MSDEEASREEEEEEQREVDIGTCQSCGAYHDAALVETCPCGGYVG